MLSRRRSIGVAVRHLADFCAVFCVTCTLLLGVWAVVPAALTALSGTVVLSGSMNPVVRPGDVVLTEPLSADRARAGMVLLLDHPEHSGPLLHRLQRISTGGNLITKGDANPTADALPVGPQQVRGVARILVPYAGLPRLWLHSGQAHLCLLWLAAISVTALYASRRASVVFAPQAVPRTGAPARRGRSRADSSRQLRSLILRRSLLKPAALTALIALALVTGISTAAAAFTARTAAALAADAAELRPPEDLQVRCNPLLGLGTGLQVTWTATTDGVSDRYQLERTLGPAVTLLGPVTANTYTDAPLTPGTTATYRVRSLASPAPWTSAWSAAVQGTVPLTCP